MFTLYSNWNEWKEYVAAQSADDILAYLREERPGMFPRVSLDGSPEPEWINAYDWVCVWDKDWVGGITEAFLDDDCDTPDDYAARADAVGGGTGFVEPWAMSGEHRARWDAFEESMR